MTSRLFASVVLLWVATAEAQPANGNAKAAATSSTSPAPAAAIGKDSRGLREILDSATRHFQAGNYEQAIVEFQEAYQKRQLPTLLFNIAQAHRKSGHWAEALSLYERFLKDDPKSSLSPEAEAHAAAMRARLDAVRATAEREAAERLAQRRTEEAEAMSKAHEAERQKADEALLVAAKQKEKPVYQKAWFWGVIGGVVAAGAITTGLVIGLRQREPSADLGVRVVEF